MTYKGVVKNGVVVLEGGGHLAEGQSVEICPVEAGEQPPSLYDRLKSVIGSAKGLPPDASKNVDHYLYGAARR